MAAMAAHKINASAVMSAFYRFNFLIPNFYLGYESSIYARCCWPFRSGRARSKESARWFQTALGLRKEFEFENGIAIGNDNITGKPSPKTFDHMSFHLPKMSILRKALAHLKKHKVKVEDPGYEIGPESPGSPHMGLWFHDPDGYRWELSVQGGK
jgi:hypothetical protein